LAKFLLLSTILAEKSISTLMPPLHFTKPKLVVKLAKTQKSASRNNPPTSTYTTNTLHIVVESSTQTTTTAPNPTQPESQQQTSPVGTNYLRAGSGN